MPLCMSRLPTQCATTDSCLSGQANPGWLPGPGGRAVAVQHLGFAGVPGGGGAVGVQDQRPAPSVDDDLMMKPAQQHAVLDAGGAAVFLVPDVVDFAGAGGLVAFSGPLAVLVSEGDGVADPGRDGLGKPDVQRQARPAQPGAELPAPQEDASPPGPIAGPRSCR